MLHYLPFWNISHIYFDEMNRQQYYESIIFWRNNTSIACSVSFFHLQYINVDLLRYSYALIGLNRKKKLYLLQFTNPKTAL